MKTYTAHIQFTPIGIKVRAKSKREAKAKVMEKIRKLEAVNLLDRKNSFVDEL